MKQGGSIANQTGNSLERFIEDTIRGEGYILLSNDKFTSQTSCANGQVFGTYKFFTKQLNICKGIYGTPIRCDFIIYHPEKHERGLIIESKWQQSAGSVDEKFPYLERNVQEKYPCRTIIVLDGGGYKPGAAEWLRSKIGGNLIGVFNMMEFRTYVNNSGI